MIGVTPRATYRVQLTPDFGFDQAASMAGYLVRLGVSHLYSSPYLQAAPGSRHGYDVVDHSRVNVELGGEEGHRRLCSALAEHGLGQVLDVVPNHMAIAGRQNRWWWDVLQNGTSSRYASYFDVSWDPPERKLKNTILVPILADHYGRILESHQLRLGREGGRLLVRYHEHEYPIDPRTYGMVLDGSFSGLAGEFASLPVLPPQDRVGALRRHRQAEALISRLQSLDAGDRVDACVRRIDADIDLLDGLLEQQNYRLARWQTADFDLDYRRFFDVNDLAALRAEDPQVFSETHFRILEWLNSGVLDGIRIDHPDGLQDPLVYFERLVEGAPRAWIVAEKVLQHGEEMPARWPIAGTTGYEFMNRALGLFVDEEAEAALTETYILFTGDIADYEDIVYEKKHQAMRDLLGSDLNLLAELFVHVCEGNRRYRDFTRRELLECLEEAIACLPVYRTYVRPEDGSVSRQDQHFVAAALHQVGRRRPDLDAELVEFLGSLLTLEQEGDGTAELVARFQQTSGPVTAKGVEDSALYAYNRLAALNEVGGDPNRFGTPVEEFHAESLRAGELWPHAMVSTSTHDTKRSEDVRARLAVLSEIPAEWESAVRRWAELNHRHRSGGFPDAGAEYLLYQTLVGAWPLEAERAQSYMIKAAREAKTQTSWISPVPEYEEALSAFVARVLADREFRNDLEGFLPPVIEAGQVNSLAMKLLCLTAPGVPDLYQGSELWDLSLVDPDNRRPVDYGQRGRLLDQLVGIRGNAAKVAWERRQEGLPKLLVVNRALALRAERPEAFATGAYAPLPVAGTRSRHALGFCRGDQVMVVVPRLSLRLGGDWEASVCELPPGRWTDRFTGTVFAGGEAALADLLCDFPVALLSRDR
ncbi:MAG: malto-oligosyltrehalose synthase [Candidatus Dormibacteraeota bacterium]|nr:malto-oligosyltrehalose synthase [Candidatus Dormibacteraeota bacterium]